MHKYCVQLFVKSTMNPTLAHYLAKSILDKTSDEPQQSVAVAAAATSSSASKNKKPSNSTENKAVKPKKDLTIPKFHRRVLVFDTETTGLMPKHKRGEPFPPDSAYPSIMQLSWSVYNVMTEEVEEAVDEYISIGPNVPIEPGAIAVSGITREIVDAKGKPLVPLLVRFYQAYMKCDCIVAHNLQFDVEMIRKEMWRNRAGLLELVKDRERVNIMLGVGTKRFNAAYHIDTFCTMMNTIDLCGMDFAPKSSDSTNVNTVETVSQQQQQYPPPPPLDEIVVSAEKLEQPPADDTPERNNALESHTLVQPPTPTPTSPPPKTTARKKFPKLAELYKVLFQTSPPDDLHNSMIDVLVCLRCFLKARGAKEIKDAYFEELVSKYSRI